MSNVYVEGEEPEVSAQDDSNSLSDGSESVILNDCDTVAYFLDENPDVDVRYFFFLLKQQFLPCLVVHYFRF